MSGHILANRTGIAVFVGVLALMGATCPACGHGTRATSKRWAKCKRCGERVRRRTAEEVEAVLREEAA